VIDIPHHLNVSLEVIERHLDSVTKRYKVSYVNGQLISGMFIDQVMEEIYEMLEEGGQLYLSELTPKFGLSMEFLKECVQHRMEN